MISEEFIAQPLDTELTRAAKFEDQRLLCREDFPAGRSVRSAAALLETDEALGLVASPPLPQRRSRDATTTANQARITELFIKPDPAKPRLGVHCVLLQFFVSDYESDGRRVAPTTAPQPQQYPKTINS